MKGALAAIACLAFLCGVALSQTAAPAKADADKFGLDGSKVTIKVKDAALDDILHALAAQSGNSLLDIPASWEAKGITFEVAGASYWEALDKLCAQLKLSYALETTGEPGNQKTALTLQDGNGCENFAAYCGPVVVKLASVTATKRYQPAPANDARGALELSLAWFCEDRLRPLETKAEVTKLTGADGKDLALAAPAADARAQNTVVGPGGVVTMRFSNAASRLARGASVLPTAGTLTAKVDALPKDVRSLKSLEGVVKMTFGKGARELKVVDVFGGKADSAEAGKDKLTVTQARRQMNWAVFVLRYTSDEKDVDLAGLAATPPYGVRLIDPNGNIHEPTNLRNMFAPAMGVQGGVIQMQGGAGANGVVEMRVQVQAGGDDAAAPVAKPPIRAGAIGAGGAGGDVNVTFMKLPDVEGPWTLVVTVPESRVAKDFAFKLTDVPLP